MQVGNCAVGEEEDEEEEEEEGRASRRFFFLLQTHLCVGGYIHTLGVSFSKNA